MVDGEEGTRLTLRNFPGGWVNDGRELLLASLTAQLEVFGTLKSEVWISRNLQEAEAEYYNAENANEAIEVLNGVDFRDPEEIGADTECSYTGLSVARKVKRSANGAWKAVAAKEEDAAAQEEEAAAKEEDVANSDMGEGTDRTEGTEGINVCPPAVVTPSELKGVWSIGYEGGDADTTYTIEDDGQVRVGKKRLLKLVPAGSAEDTKQDPHYAGTYLLDNAHREGTWEYIWMEDGALTIHHFTAEGKKTSPYGSPKYWGCGIGKPCDEVPAQTESWKSSTQAEYWPKKRQRYEKDWQDWKSSPAANKNAPNTFAKRDVGTPTKFKKQGPSPSAKAVADLEGVWSICYEGDTERPSVYTITAQGDVTVGKKRQLKLVRAGSPQDSVKDPNYAVPGVFLLDQCHREDTWEYMWLESGMLCVHHFTTYDKNVSPYGSGNFWGTGIGSLSESSAGQAKQMWSQQKQWPQKQDQWSQPRQQWSQPKQPQKQQQWYQPKQQSGAQTQGQTPSMPSGAPTYWGMVRAMNKAAANQGNGVLAGDEMETPPDAMAAMVSALEGNWLVDYEPGGDPMKYIVNESGEVRIGKKRKGQLVPAGSSQDCKRDSNYLGAFFLNNPHREDTWEYIWLEDDKLQVHHFTGQDTRQSPLGSPNYFGSAVGVRSEL